MGYGYMKNTELSEALHIYLREIDAVCSLPENEIIQVNKSCGRYTAQPVFARISSPHYNSCAMDGIAVRSKDTFGATDTTPVLLKESTDFVRVDTGDSLPRDFDSVVMIEEVVELGSQTIKLLTSASPWQHVRQIGEDICAGEMILPSNTRIEPSAIGAMHASGVLEVSVKKIPFAALIPTGNEIVKPSPDVKEGQIIECNSSIFSAMLESYNIDTSVFDIVPDDLSLLKHNIKKACELCDIVLINAGSSAGSKDYTAKAISELGTVVLHGIAIRPGKPTILGIVDSKPVIGIPGYPVSGAIVIEKVVLPVLEHLTGIEYPKRETVYANLTKRVVSSLKYAEYIRVKLGEVDNQIIATPLTRGAGIITSLVKADGLMEIPLNEEGVEAGSKVNIELFKGMNDVKNTAVVIGSHDFLLDIVTDIMKRRYGRLSVSSAHVGSMGGIAAIKRGEAHIAGIHLLDEITGEYNISYVKKYFPEGKVVIVTGVNRIQGLIVPAGNPENVRAISDVASKRLKYVNRQKGSGTRVLFDYLLKKENISQSLIDGYQRESHTHISVAALIAARSADAGLGVLTAAKAYGLDFIPICDEKYDFVIPERYLEQEKIKAFIDILKSDEFKLAMEAMGGYKLESPGDIVRL